MMNPPVSLPGKQGKFVKIIRSAAGLPDHSVDNTSAARNNDVDRMKSGPAWIG